MVADGLSGWGVAREGSVGVGGSGLSIGRWISLTGMRVRLALVDCLEDEGNGSLLVAA